MSSFTEIKFLVGKMYQIEERKGQRDAERQKERDKWTEMDIEKERARDE